MRRATKYVHNGNTYRSKFEVSMAKILEAAKIPFAYEDTYLKYEIPVQHRKYYPDFCFKSHTYDYIETKGRFTGADRRKMLLVLEHNPGIKILMVFQNPNVTLSKVSKTTYAEWCDKHGIDWTTVDKVLGKLRKKNGRRKS